MGKLHPSFQSSQSLLYSVNCPAFRSLSLSLLAKGVGQTVISPFLYILSGDMHWTAYASERLITTVVCCLKDGNLEALYILLH